MTDKPTDKQIKEFWGWCGLEYKQVQVRVCGYQTKTWAWTYGIETLWVMPDPDLNNLFKYAVEQVIVYLMGHLTYDRISAVKYLFKLWLKEYIKCWDFELALFWAIWEVINDR